MGNWDCYRFGIKTGIKSVMKGNGVIGFKQSMFPISYWRFPIFGIVLDNLRRKGRGTILDIGSPKLLSLYLAIECKWVVYATDLQDQQIFSSVCLSTWHLIQCS